MPSDSHPYGRGLGEVNSSLRCATGHESGLCMQLHLVLAELYSQSFARQAVALQFQLH